MKSHDVRYNHETGFSFKMGEHDCVVTLTGTDLDRARVTVDEWKICGGVAVGYYCQRLGDNTYRRPKVRYETRGEAIAVKYKNVDAKEFDAMFEQCRAEHMSNLEALATELEEREKRQKTAYDTKGVIGRHHVLVESLTAGMMDHLLTWWKLQKVRHGLTMKITTVLDLYHCSIEYDSLADWLKNDPFAADEYAEIVSTWRVTS